ncbi:vacuolar ATPase assembly integral membrane protein vma21 [Microsporum canis]
MATRRGASKETQPEISSPRPSQPTGPEFRQLPGTYAGAAAAGAANIVLIVYIIFAIREDNEIEKKAEEEFKKNR